MKKLIVLVLVVVMLSSCSKYVTVERAANGKVRCGQGLR